MRIRMRFFSSAYLPGIMHLSPSSLDVVGCAAVTGTPGILSIVPEIG
jgi:hypothetical protein